MDEGNHCSIHVICDPITLVFLTDQWGPPLIAETHPPEPMYTWDDVDLASSHALNAASHLGHTFYGYKDPGHAPYPLAFLSYQASYYEVPIEANGGGRCIVPLDEDGQPCAEELRNAHQYLLLKPQVTDLLSHTHLQ